MTSPGHDPELLLAWVRGLLAGSPAATWRLTGGGVTGSTQDDAKALSGEGDPGPVVVLATRQTSGRGRFDREWESPEGGLYFSAMLRPAMPASRAAVLPLVAGLGVAHGLEAAFDGLTVSLKWPNDLRVAGPDGSLRKISGILSESAAAGDRLAWVAIGVGIDLARPAEPVPGAGYLEELGSGTPDLALVAAAAIDGLAQALAELSSVGFGPMADEYAARSDIIGSEVTVREANGRPIASGTVTGFDEGGRLVLEGGDGEVRIAAGEVTLRG